MKNLARIMRERTPHPHPRPLPPEGEGVASVPSPPGERVRVRGPHGRGRRVREYEQLRRRPVKGSNSLAWLLWHMARIEDVAVNVVVANRRQVFDEGWAERLKVPRRNAMHLGEAITIRGQAGLALGL